MRRSPTHEDAGRRAGADRQLLIGGPWRPTPRPARPSTSTTPRPGEVLARRRRRGPGRRPAALDAAVAAQAGLGRGRRPRERSDILAPGLRAAPRAHRRPRPADDAGDGQAAGRGPGRDRLRRRVLPLVRRGGRADRRRLPVAPDGQGRFLRHAPAGRAVPADHALELPDGHGHPQDRPRHRRRLHDGRQARRADAAVDAGARAASCSEAGPAGRRRSTSSPPRTPAP